MNRPERGTDDTDYYCSRMRKQPFAYTQTTVRVYTNDHSRIHERPFSLPQIQRHKNIGGAMGARWVHAGGAVFCQLCTLYSFDIQNVYSKGCTGAQFFCNHAIHTLISGSQHGALTVSERRSKKLRTQHSESRNAALGPCIKIRITFSSFYLEKCTFLCTFAAIFEHYS